MTFGDHDVDIQRYNFSFEVSRSIFLSNIGSGFNVLLKRSSSKKITRNNSISSVIRVGLRKKRLAAGHFTVE